MDQRIALDDPAAHPSAERVAASLAAQLQRGGEKMDADTYDAWFADDILWGSPFGATLAGFAELNAVHKRLMETPATQIGESRFEVVSVLAPAPGVVVTQIRRRALTPGDFSEMALYVLIERDARWWLAAAQNTPVQ